MNRNRKWRNRKKKCPQPEREWPHCPAEHDENHMKDLIKGLEKVNEGEVGPLWKVGEGTGVFEIDLEE